MPANANGSKWIQPSTRLAIYLRDRFRCVYCGKDLHGVTPRELTLDHMLPRFKGGTNKPSNLMTCCLACNVAKRHDPWRDYVRKVWQRRARAMHVKDQLIAQTEADWHIDVLLRRKRQPLNWKLANSILDMWKTTRTVPEALR